MNRRDMLISAAAVAGAGALGRFWPRSAPAHPLALDAEALDTLKALAKPTPIGIGLHAPHQAAAGFDTVTPCNALKWRHIQRHGWGDADAIAATGKPIRAHTPLWGFEQGRTPPDRVEGFTREIAARYGAQIYAWDIANEPIHWPYCTDRIAALVKLARELTPQAAIILNEYDAIHYLQGFADTSVLTPLIEMALSVGADGIGVQAHGNRWYSRQELQKSFNDVAAAGLMCHVTEAIYRSDNSPIAYGHADAPGHYGTWTEDAQALAYRDLLAVARAHPAVKSVTFWTLSDGDAWEEMPQGGLLRADMTPKPAWYERGQL